MEDLKDLWKTTLAQIEVKLDSTAQFKTWFKDTVLIDIADKTATIGVKNTYAADWLSKKHYDMIRSCINYVYGEELKLDFIVDKSLANIPTESLSHKEAQSEKPLFSLESGENNFSRSVIESSGLNPKYTFQNFIVGDSNNLAHAAALAVADKPGTTYNPLFIHGKTGLGKTHLAQAVGRSVLDRFSGKKVFYAPSETFLNDMITAIKTGKNLDFRRKFRSVDVLVIDDIQLIAKWPRTQVEFFNTFNTLYNFQKQIILTSDQPPERLGGIDERLRSRFSGGMVVEVYKPDVETRIAIIQKKAQSLNINLSHRIYEYIAKEITDNIRELEGGVQKIALYNSMVNYELSIEEVAKILGIDTKSKRDRIKVPLIIKRVSDEYEVSVKDIKGPKRTATVAFARQVVMYILRVEFQYKLERIAELLNRKDHTTVIHAVDKIDSMRMTDEGFSEQLESIAESLRSGNYLG